MLIEKREIPNDLIYRKEDRDFNKVLNNTALDLTFGDE